MDWVLALVVLVVVALVAVGAWYFNDYRNRKVVEPVSNDVPVGTVVESEVVVAPGVDVTEPVVPVVQPVVPDGPATEPKADSNV